MNELVTVSLLTLCFSLLSLVIVKQDVKVYYDPIIKKLSDDLERIYPDIKKHNIIILGANDTFTENKKKIFICLRKKDGEYYDYHTLLYISLHELAHVLTEAYDNHGDQFNKTFSALLLKAKNIGLYDETKKIKYDYCGTKHLSKDK